MRRGTQISAIGAPLTWRAGRCGEVRDIVAVRATSAAPPKVLSIEISEFRRDACVVWVDDGQNRALARLPLDEAGRFLTALAEAVGPAQASQVDIDVSSSSGCQIYHSALDLSGITRGSQPWVKDYGLTTNNTVRISARSLSKSLRGLGQRRGRVHRRARQCDLCGQCGQLTRRCLSSGPTTP